jgi:acyl transferase domain-containing protein
VSREYRKTAGISSDIAAERTKLGGGFPIAVVGAACRFPGAANLGEFWSLLRSGTDAVGPVPEDRWDVAASFHRDPAKPGKSYARDGGFIADIDKFDAGFFGISPREARRIDPQQRILLELTWEAMEDAGIVPGRLAGSQTGVFVGISFSDYAALQREDPERTDAYVMSGSAVSNAANRISYIFDLHGPSFAVDTACSSSLVAVHQACVSLWRGESSTAIAGGVNALLSPSGFIGFSKAHMLSPSGRCRAFDAAGDGYARAEGGAVVVLQPLARAIAEGNQVWAVIAGSGVNSDGRTAGLAMPNPAAQEDLLRRVYREAGIDPGAVAYVEAHGTGTGVGDPAECTALGRVFGAARAPGDPCRIGSVKTNIGHLEPASGIAGLVKLLLALRHRALPRSLHLVTPSPQISFAELNLSVVAEHIKLPPGPLIMAVNSFGFGGTNAHVVLREPDAPVAISQETEWHGTYPLLISAHSGEALASLAMRYAELLRSPDAPPLPAVCKTAATRRMHHPHRLAVFGSGGGEVAGRLEAFAAGGAAPLLVERRAPGATARLAFVFSGNGSQWRGMGDDLLAEPLAAEWIARIDAALQPDLGWSVAAVLQSPDPDYDRTEIAQPALFAVQVAVFEWLRAHGIEAEAVVGHSVGEIAAAYAAGILSLAEACRVIAARSRAQQRTAGAGRMAALRLSADEAAAAVRPYEERLTVAGINSPRSVTVAGYADAIAALGAKLRDRRVFFRELGLDYAFHSPAMDAIRGELLDGLDGLTPRQGQCRFVSTVTGAEIAADRLGAAYWWDNIRKPVLFAPAIGALSAAEVNAFLEIGPHPILDGYLRECLRADGGSGVVLASLRRQEPERDALWRTLGRCYTAGVAIDFDRLFPEQTAVVPLPAYPWQRERYWFSDSEDGFAEPARPRKHPLLGKRLPTVAAVWQNRLDPAAISWLPDHVVQGSIVVPGAAFIEMAFAAASWEAGVEAVEIARLEIRRPLVIAAGTEPAIEAGLSAEDGGFHLYAGDAAGGSAPPAVVARAVPLAAGRSPAPVTLSAIRQRMSRRIDGAELYRRFADHGLAYGPAFQGVAEAWAADGEALGRITAPAAIEAELGEYCIHPAVLDACLQVTLAALPEELGVAQAMFVPSTAERIRFYGGDGRIAWCHMRLTQIGARSIVGSFRLIDETERVVAEIDGMRLRRVELGVAGEIPAYHWAYQLRPSAASHRADDLPGPLALAAFASADGGDSDGDVRETLDRLAMVYARAALAEITGASGAFVLPAPKANGSAPPARAVARLLARLENAGMAQRDGAAWRLAGGDPARTPTELWREALARRPAHLPSLQLIARCGDALPAVLRGQADAAPESGSDFLAQLYDADPLFHGAAETVARMLRQVCVALPDTRLLRVLAIGVNGGLGEALAAALPAERSECVLAEPGRGLPEQGFGPAQQDIVVAGAALATSYDLDGDLAAIATVLKPGGLFIAVAPEPGGFLDLAGAVYPSLREAVETDWRRALADAGFDEVVSAGADNPAGSGAVIVGRKPAAAVLPSPRPIKTSLWVVLSGDWLADLASALMGRLEDLYQRAVIVDEVECFERRGPDRFATPRGDRDGYARLLRALVADGVPWLHLVYLRGAAETEPTDPLVPAGSYDLATLVQAVIDAGLAPMTSLTIATSGAMPAVGGKGGVARPWQAPLWGIARTVMNERPDIVCRAIDLDPEASAATAIAGLCDELLNPDDENEILLRGGGRYAPRLTCGLPQSSSGAADDDAAFTLGFGEREAQERAALNRIAIPRPGAGEVSVRVHAAGVNLRDVLQRTGLLPEEAFEEGFAGPTLGLEFAGEVIEIGEQVDRLRPGDAVFGFGRNAFTSHLTAPAFCLFRKPAAMSFAEAATLPVAAVTAYYSLHQLARLAEGERILIHGAAGGVGLAAVQYAQSVGAEIFASAGTPEKRALLGRLGYRMSSIRAPSPSPTISARSPAARASTWC